MAGKKRATSSKSSKLLNKFKVSNRLSYTILSVIILVLAAAVVYAANIAPGTVPNPGHSISQLGSPSSCAEGQFLKWTGVTPDGGWACATVTAGGQGATQWAPSGNDIYNSNTGNVTIGSGIWGKTVQFSSATGPRIYGVQDAIADGFSKDNALILYSGQGGTFGQGTGLVKVMGNFLVMNDGLGIKTVYTGLQSVGDNTLSLQAFGGKAVEIGSVSNLADLTVFGNIKAKNGLKTFVGATTSTYDGGEFSGGVGGYSGGDAKCAAQFGAGARMAYVGDFVNGRPTVEGWYNGFSGDSSSFGDCYTWKASTDSYQGLIWDVANRPSQSACNAKHHILCVK